MPRIDDELGLVELFRPPALLGPAAQGVRLLLLQPFRRPGFHRHDGGLWPFGPCRASGIEPARQPDRVHRVVKGERLLRIGAEAGHRPTVVEPSSGQLQIAGSLAGGGGLGAQGVGLLHRVFQPRFHRQHPLGVSAAGSRAPGLLQRLLAGAGLLLAAARPFQVEQREAECLALAALQVRLLAATLDRALHGLALALLQRDGGRCLDAPGLDAGEMPRRIPGPLRRASLSSAYRSAWRRGLSSSKPGLAA